MFDIDAVFGEGEPRKSYPVRHYAKGLLTAPQQTVQDLAYEPDFRNKCWHLIFVSVILAIFSEIAISVFRVMVGVYSADIALNETKFELVVVLTIPLFYLLYRWVFGSVLGQYRLVGSAFVFAYSALLSLLGAILYVLVIPAVLVMDFVPFQSGVWFDSAWERSDIFVQTLFFVPGMAYAVILTSGAFGWSNLRSFMMVLVINLLVIVVLSVVVLGIVSAIYGPTIFAN